MQVYKKIVFVLFALLTYSACVWGQTRADSLLSILDGKNYSDTSFIKTTLELCRILVNTDSSFLIPEYANQALKADTLNKDIQSKFALYQYLGNYYWQIGKLTEAADQFNKMRLIGETSMNSKITANSYNGLGTVYYKIGDYDHAREYYRKGLSLAGTDTLLKARFLNNIANTFVVQDKMDSVMAYYHMAIAYHKSHQNFRLLSIVYGNLALANFKLRDGLEIRRNLDLALEAAILSNDPYQIASIYQLTGDLAFEKHPQMAVKSYHQALTLARKSKSYDQIQKNLDVLSILAENDGKYREALSYLRELKQLGDSLNQKGKESRIEQMEYEHIAALRNAEETKKAQEEEVRLIRDQNRQRLLLVIVSVAFVTLLILILSEIQTYRIRMKISRSKERFFSMIAHDIRNPFSGILGLSGILNEEAEKSGDPVHRKQMGSLHKSLNQVYELLENLLQWSLSETGKIAFNPQVQMLYPIVQEVIFLHTASAKQKGIKLENQVQGELTARFDSNMLQTVIRNLLSNAIKFSPENSSIFLSAIIQGKGVMVKVSDQGVGMNPEQINRIFKPDENISTPGTRNEAGTGMGLILSANFIARHGGRIWAESEPSKGTTMFFTLPD